MSDLLDLIPVMVFKSQVTPTERGTWAVLIDVRLHDAAAFSECTCLHHVFTYVDEHPDEDGLAVMEGRALDEARDQALKRVNSLALAEAMADLKRDMRGRLDRRVAARQAFLRERRS